MNKPFHILAAVAALGTALAAQTLTIPALAATADLPSTTGWPFDYAGNMRILYVYDASHFTSQSVAAPVLISRMRIRANGAAATWVGDTVNSLTVDLSTSTVDYLLPSTTYDANHGQDRSQVFSGSVAIPGGTAVAGQPGPWVVDVTFTTPFLYDPNAGDLTIDMISSGPSSATNTPTLDASSTAGQALARRVYGLSYAGSPTGTLWSGESAHAIEFTYTPAAGYASTFGYGSGCYDRAGSVYETFTGNFDLGGSPTNSLKFFPNGTGGFTVIPGSNTFLAPTSPDFVQSDDSLTPALTLPFAFPFGTYSATAVKMCSNGFLWLDATATATDLSPTPAELLSQGPRIAPLWMDLNPASLDPATQTRLGSTHFDIDPSSGNPVFTWLNVSEFGTANVANRNTFQIELEPTGAFELRWQNIATTATRSILTGASFGVAARDGGSYDLSAAVPFATLGDTDALRVIANGRPTLGTSITLDTTSIPGNVLVGASLFGFTQFDPGVSLASLGAPGCSQYTSIDAAAIFVSTGTSHSLPQAFPADPAFAGLRIYAQTAVLSPGVNSLGMLTSNGVALLLDIN